MASVARQIHSVVKAVVEAHSRADGASADAYIAVPVYHPMADGKFLRTLNVMHDNDLISCSSYETKAGRAVTRLANSVSPAASTGAAWGLRFKYKNNAADEPYLITTAQIVIALLEAGQRLSRPELALELASSGLRWLTEGVPRKMEKAVGRRVGLPVFSPNMELLVVNTIAAWAESLHRGAAAGLLVGHEEDVEATACWVEAQWLPGLGWRYGPDNNVIDLLHQTYIIDALTTIRGPGSQHDRLFDIVSTFRTGDSYLDTSKIYTRENYDRPLQAYRSPRVNVHANLVQVFGAPTARPWSIGGLLSSLADAAAVSLENDVFWRYALRLTSVQGLAHSERMLSQQFFLRDLTHLAEGLAKALAVLRRVE